MLHRRGKSSLEVTQSGQEEFHNADMLNIKRAIRAHLMVQQALSHHHYIYWPHRQRYRLKSCSVMLCKIPS